LPEFTSLDDAYQAVDAVLDCADDAPVPPAKLPPPSGPTGEAVMRTETVEVLWSETQEGYDNVYDLYAGAAESGSVYFVEGRNWLEGLAENVDAKYTVKR
jgi:hypothetical protein